MKNNLPSLSKKTLTHLLDSDFRDRILKSISTTTNETYRIASEINSYARYVVDSQILSRDKKLENDKNSYYGFQPLNIICAIMNDGTIDKRFIEFNTVNHFLKQKQGELAIDVVKCILILWKNENNKIASFDYNKIDNELAKIEKDYLKNNKAKENKDEAQC